MSIDVMRRWKILIEMVDDVCVAVSLEVKEESFRIHLM